MRHRMHLETEYFQAIKEGSKKIEIRLADKKRQRLRLGDQIEFYPLKGKETPILVSIKTLQRFSSFKELYKSINSEDLGTVDITIEEMLEQTYEMYSPEAEEKWGVLAIGIE